MDKKTEALRDIFVAVTDEETVTERQEESRGSLAGDAPTAERLSEVVSRMRERYEFSTPLSDDELVAVVERYYHEESDGAIARELDVSDRHVFQARLELHLFRERDVDAPFDLDDLRAMLVEDLPTSEMAGHLGVSESTIHRYRRVIEAKNEARRVSDRFRSEFEDVLVEAELHGQFTTDVNEDGLEEATDGMETDVSF